MVELILIIPVGLLVVFIVGYIAHKKRWKIADIF